MAADLTVRVFDNIDEVPQTAWDRLATHSSPFYSYGWFKTFIRTMPSPVFFTAWQGGQLVGLLPAYVVRDHNANAFHNVREALLYGTDPDLADYLKRIGHPRLRTVQRCISLGKYFKKSLSRMLFPNLVFISPAGFISDLLIDHGVSGKNCVVNALLGNADSYCRSNNIKVQSALWVHDDNEFFKTSLKDYGYHEMYGEVEFYLRRNWDSLDTMLKEYAHTVRRRITKDMHKWRAEGISTKCIDDPKEIRKHAVVLSEILSKQWQRYDHPALHAGNPYDVVMNMLGNMPGQTYCVLAEKNGEVYACNLGFIKDSKRYSKFYAIADPQNDRGVSYYNLCYHTQYAMMFSHDISEISYGMGSPHAKLIRGCAARDVHCYFKFNGALARYLLPHHVRRLSTIKRQLYAELVSSTKSWRNNE